MLGRNTNSFSQTGTQSEFRTENYARPKWMSAHCYWNWQLTNIENSVKLVKKKNFEFDRNHVQTFREYLAAAKNNGRSLNHAARIYALRKFSENNEKIKKSSKWTGYKTTRIRTPLKKQSLDWRPEPSRRAMTQKETERRDQIVDQLTYIHVLCDTLEIICTFLRMDYRVHAWRVLPMWIHARFKRTNTINQQPLANRDMVSHHARHSQPSRTRNRSCVQIREVDGSSLNQKGKKPPEIRRKSHASLGAYRDQPRRQHLLGVCHWSCYSTVVRMRTLLLLSDRGSGTPAKFPCPGNKEDVC